MYVGVGVMYWISLVLVRPAVSLHSASPLKHHAMGRQGRGCPNSDHYLGSELASWSLLCAERQAEQQNLKF